MKVINTVASFLRRVKEQIAKESQDKRILARSTPDLKPKKIIVGRVETEIRFFYRDAGLSSANRRYYYGLLRKGNLPESERAIIKELLNSPRNIPYKSGQIPFQHAGNASPIKFLRDVPGLLAKSWAKAGITLHPSQIRGAV